MGGVKKKIYQPLQICIGSTIRIGRESWCLPYAGFWGYWRETRIFHSSKKNSSSIGESIHTGKHKLVTENVRNITIWNNIIKRAGGKMKKVTLAMLQYLSIHISLMIYIMKPPCQQKVHWSNAVFAKKIEEKKWISSQNHDKKFNMSPGPERTY